MKAVTLAIVGLGMAMTMEATAQQSHFPALDKDHDGYLTEAPAPSARPAAAVIATAQ